MDQESASTFQWRGPRKREKTRPQTVLLGELETKETELFNEYNTLRCTSEERRKVGLPRIATGDYLGDMKNEKRGEKTM